ncbi:MAG: cysteine hydrolase [Clostridia bacterium]|nr:cysteine hydrolase [Clostridia bacterium]
MQDILIVVDMQNDFISGSLGTSEAQSITPNVLRLIKDFDGKIIFTKDTHEANYLDTKEGKNLPVAHCIKGTQGWEIEKSLLPYTKEIIEKPTFGSLELVKRLQDLDREEKINTITFVGLCTDICVISNVLLTKSAFLEAEIIVDASCCAGVSPQSHKNALEAMKMCQIKIVGE